MKIYVDKNLTLRHSLEGWPEELAFVKDVNLNGESTVAFEGDEYEKALDKAKKNSVLVIDQDGFTCVNNAGTPDSFVDFPIDIETGWQYYAHEWRDCIGDPMNYMDYMTRQVARMKKQESGPSIKVHGQGFHIDKMKSENAAHGYSEGSDIPNALVEKPGPDKIRCDCELFVEKYFGLPANFPVDSLVPEAQYFQLVNLISMFRDEQLAAANQTINDLKRAIIDGTNLASGIGWDGDKPEIEKVREQLAAANKKIEGLERWKEEELCVWGPILDYCHDEKNAKRLCIGLGDSISTRVLEILKGIK